MEFETISRQEFQSQVLEILRSRYSLQIGGLDDEMRGFVCVVALGCLGIWSTEWAIGGF
jgi:hypothetical protein